MVAGIYAIINIDSGDFYIGSSKNLRSRWFNHKNRLRASKSCCKHLQNSWNKYGESAFEFLVLEECSIEVLLNKEQWYLDHCKPTLNILTIAGNTSGMKHSEITKIKIGVKAKIQVRHNLTNEHKSNLSKSIKTKYDAGWKNPNTGKSTSEETKSKLSKANIGKSATTGFAGKKKSPESIVRSLRNREVVRTKASEIVELVRSGISISAVARRFGLINTTVSKLVKASI